MLMNLSSKSRSCDIHRDPTTTSLFDISAASLDPNHNMGFVRSHANMKRCQCHPIPKVKECASCRSKNNTSVSNVSTVMPDLVLNL
jgi:hypothetical protein